MLVREFQLEYSPALTKFVDDAVSSIKKAIDIYNSRRPQGYSCLAPGFVKDIGADKVEFDFKKPKSVKIGGSYVIECLV